MTQSVVPVVIVNFNAGARLADCVESVLRSAHPVVVFVSDNGSTDASLELLRQRCGGDVRLTIVENRANLGFAKANNRILPLLPASETVLFLNPDCVLQPDTLARMLPVLKQTPQAGMACCLIANADGSEQRGCRRTLPTPWQSLVQVLQLQRLFPGSPRFRSFNLTGTPLPPHPVEVEAISGAFMLVRRSAIESVGPLDEGYFLHCEDIDWCARFTLAGFRILFVPQISIVHYQGTCSNSRPLRVEWHKHRGMLRFYRKFYARRYPLPLMLAVYAFVCVRMALIALRLGVQQLTPSQR
ncbi:MAG: glycosyltransferase family 2 protein [Chitinivorax sp.]